MIGGKVRDSTTIHLGTRGLALPELASCSRIDYRYVLQISLVKRVKLDVMKNVTEEFYDGARVLCAIVKGPKHTVEIHFQFANPWPEGQGYYLKDENGKERRNNGQLWEDFRTALRQAHLVAERL